MSETASEVSVVKVVGTKEALLRFGLTDIRAVRISCNRGQAPKLCSGVLEVSVGELSKAIRCPVCQADLLAANDVRLAALQKAIEGIGTISPVVMQLELVLPAKVAEEG